MVERAVEYVIYLTNGEEFITENKEEADDLFYEDERAVDQYYRKVWVKAGGDWVEDDVVVYK